MQPSINIWRYWLLEKNSQLDVEFTKLALTAAYPELRFLSDGNGGTKGALTCVELKRFQIPIPATVTDQRIISKLHNIHSSEIYILMKESYKSSQILFEKSRAINIIHF